MVMVVVVGGKSVEGVSGVRALAYCWAARWTLEGKVPALARLNPEGTEMGARSPVGGTEEGARSSTEGAESPETERRPPPALKARSAGGR